MKTKFIKVSVEERLPEKNKCVKVLCPSGNVYEGFVTDKDIWQVYTQFEYGRIEHWIEEVPDREDEMREMLEKIIYTQFTSGVPLSSLNAEISNARDYLKQLKN